MLILALGGIWALAFHSAVAARADANALAAFIGMGHRHAALVAIARALTTVCEPLPYLGLCAVPIAVALLRRRWSLAAALIVAIPAAVLCAELGKAMLPPTRPAPTVAGALTLGGSFPSGHSTGSMVLVLAWVLASPRRLRPLIAGLGAVLALGVGYSVLTLGWHYPSDVLGGVLLASLWILLALAAVWTFEAHDRGVASTRCRIDLSHPPAWRILAPALPGVMGAAASGAATMLIWRGGRAVTYAQGHPAFIVAGLAVGMLAVLAPASATVALSGSDPAARAVRHPRWRPG